MVASATEPGCGGGQNVRGVVGLVIFFVRRRTKVYTLWDPLGLTLIPFSITYFCKKAENKAPGK